VKIFTVSFLIRNLNFDDISILQLILLPQLHFAGDFDNSPRLHFAVGFVRPQDDSRPTKYFAGHDTNRDSPAVLFRLQACPAPVANQRAHPTQCSRCLGIAACRSWLDSGLVTSRSRKRSFQHPLLLSPSRLSLSKSFGPLKINGN